MKDINDRTHKPRSDIRKFWHVMTFYERFEHIVAIALGTIISIVIIFSLLQLIRQIYHLLIANILTTPLNHGVFQGLFGMIMTLLIAMEFKHSILKVLMRQSHIVQAQGVILIAMLALTRKLIILDFSTIKPEKLASLGFVVLVLGITYYLLKQEKKG